MTAGLVGASGADDTAASRVPALFSCAAALAYGESIFTEGSGQDHDGWPAFAWPASEELVAGEPPTPGHDALTLRVKGLTKIYQSGEVQVHALRGIDLDLATGELVVLLGPSGSGKSTLLNILGGLDAASSGEAWFQEHDLTRASDRDLTRYRREHVGFVFQFYNLIPSLTALENVALVTEIATAPMDPAAALELVGLGPRLHHFPAQLSGGEQQRVAIARAIAKRPAILLCDEPTGALDSQTGILVLEAIERIHRELGTTTVLITHNAVIAEMADRVIVLGDGLIQHTHRNEQRRPARELTW